MLFVRLEEAGLADQPAGLLALGVDTNVENVVAFVTLKQTLGRHRPLNFLKIFVDPSRSGFPFLRFPLLLAQLRKRDTFLGHFIIYYHDSFNIISEDAGSR